MIYTANLGAGQQLWIENQGTQTSVGLSSSAAGQQQSQSTGFQTGQWVAPPTLFRTTGGFLLQLVTAQGAQYLQVQGGHVQGLNSAPDLEAATVVPLEPGTAPSVQPMQPMQPMQMGELKMGNMRMQMNPMQMKMGNMELKMGNSNAAEPPPEPSATRTSPNFCSQCGQPLQGGDRFCASCGHRVSAGANPPTPQ